eukprot:TRINITY_DN6875_c0_g1_i1.p1 TRINITY_DN6875_c0_g1~~TRINITY_DN6875_c0_g1_i1.p1  ORF type:complete len:237 (-),score=42.49 TRINITY_DN6875_c0_g1_i1:48-758(-)
MASPDWTLHNCCNVHQIVFLSLVGGYLLVNLLFWRTCILKPMKLVAVFVHELSHALACWMTCGKVKGIHVYTNEGGVTQYEGGIRLVVIPAGYLGCAFWGMTLVILSGNRIAATCAASALAAALLVSLWFSPNWTMVWLNLGFCAITVACILIEWLVFTPFLGFVTLYYGVFIGAFAIYDIYDDLITRTVEGSDAHACHQSCPCCLPRLVGLTWGLIAIGMLAAGVYLSLVWIEGT